MALRRIPLVIAALSVASLAAACTHTVAPSASPHQIHPESGTSRAASVPDPEEIDANELGMVPVLMYHRLVEEPTSVYDRTPAGFRAELERLAREDYVPVTMAEFATGEIDIPAGTHPVVLTFDDGDPSTIGVTRDGRLVEGTALEILTDVAREYPAFRATASVYVNAEPFGGAAAGARALDWLREHGFEIGNHTYAHTNLSTASRDRVQRAVAKGDKAIRAALRGYAPSTLALPFGARPEPAELALRGAGYDYSAVLLVGANPAPSPYTEAFDPAGVPRIRSQGPDGTGAEFGSTAWLDKLAQRPGLRYTSDGDPSRISYPDGDDSLAAEFAESAEPY